MKKFLTILLPICLFFNIQAASLLEQISQGVDAYVNKQFDSARKIFLEIAETNNNPIAQYNLGLIYENGEGVTKNINTAILWFTKAAEQNDIKAQNKLGLIYLDTKQYTSAFKWFKRAAENGDIQSQNLLGNLYEQGLGTSHSPTDAIEWYKKAAEQNYYLAQYNLAYLYKNSTDINLINYERSAYWYEKAANQGYSYAQNNLALMYEEGLGVAKDYKQAAYWYEKAANQGFTQAAYNLGFMYANADGIERNYQQAFKWWNEAANQGDNNSQYQLGKLYAKGLGITKDMYQAYYWYSQAAKNDNINAQFTLAYMHENGIGIDLDYDKARSWYERAANAGHRQAQNNLALIYQEGKGVDINYDSAIYWFEKAAREGDRLALNNLGKIFEYGLGEIAVDRQKAMRFYKAARSNRFIDLSNDLNYCATRTTKFYGLKIKCEKQEKIIEAIDEKQSQLPNEFKNGNTLSIINKKIVQRNKTVFDSRSLLKDSFDLTLYFDYDKNFAKASYRFKTKDKNKINDLADKLASKYGNYDHNFGVDYIGKYSFIWNMPDGIVLELYRNFPDVTTFIEFTSPRHYAKMLNERKKRNLIEVRRQQSIQEQFYAF